MQESISDKLCYLKEYWGARARDNIDDCTIVESGMYGQKTRFYNFLKHIKIRNSSILDVGCGVASFYDLLKKLKIKCDYSGNDISKEMLAIARKRHPTIKFSSNNILNFNNTKRWDYVVSFAIHNIKHKNCLELFKKVTRKQFQLCKIAAHTDILTNEYKYFATHIQSWSPPEILKICLSISSKVELRHNYLPNCFSITLFK